MPNSSANTAAGCPRCCSERHDAGADRSRVPAVRAIAAATSGPAGAGRPRDALDHSRVTPARPDSSIRARSGHAGRDSVLAAPCAPARSITAGGRAPWRIVAPAQKLLKVNGFWLSTGHFETRLGRLSNDPGSGSLRDAVGSAVDGDVIDRAELACSTISLATGYSTISANFPFAVVANNTPADTVSDISKHAAGADGTAGASNRATSTDVCCRATRSSPIRRCIRSATTAARRGRTHGIPAARRSMRATARPVWTRTGAGCRASRGPTPASARSSGGVRTVPT